MKVISTIAAPKRSPLKQMDVNLMAKYGRGY